VTERARDEPERHFAVREREQGTWTGIEPLAFGESRARGRGLTLLEIGDGFVEECLSRRAVAGVSGD
jgi:hypothetical protein